MDEKFGKQLRTPAEHPHECVGRLSKLGDGRKSQVSSVFHLFIQSFIHSRTSVCVRVSDGDHGDPEC